MKAITGENTLNSICIHMYFFKHKNSMAYTKKNIGVGVRIPGFTFLFAFYQLLYQKLQVVCNGKSPEFAVRGSGFKSHSDITRM